MSPQPWALELIVAGACVSCYGLLGFVVSLFRPAIDRAAKPGRKETYL